MDPEEEKLIGTDGEQAIPETPPETEQLQGETEVGEESPDEEAAGIEEAGESTENTMPDNGEISKYFPNVTVTEENRTELERAVKAMDSQRELNLVLRDPINRDFALALIDIRDGMPGMMAISKHFDLEGAKPVEGEEMYPEFQKNKETRVQRIKQQEDYQNELSANEEESRQNLINFKSEHSMQDEDFAKFWEFFMPICVAAMKGKVSKELIESSYALYNRDADLANAQAIGENVGINKKIADVTAKEEEQMKGDGMPVMGGAISTPNQGRPGNKISFKAREEFRV